jgi:alkylhydroperoxidase/carboxymuconolactone decarboxylase family protein YurZ
VADVAVDGHIGHIAALCIVYGTAAIRPVVEEETGRRPWRGQRSSPLAGDVPGRCQRWSAGVSSEVSDRAPQQTGEVPVTDETADTPVLDTLADMTTASLEHNTLSPRELMLVRLAALIAVDAPPASYLLNAGPAGDIGVTAEDVQGIMIGIAPVVGAPRVIAASGNIVRAFGFAIAVAESEIAESVDGGIP